MSKSLMILKLGGSVVTYKDSFLPKARISTIRRLAKEIKLILDKNLHNLIIIHGVGSFGHPLAKKYNLVNGMQTIDKKLGYCKMEQVDLQLHNKILSILIKFGVSAVGLSPHCFAKTSENKFTGFNLNVIKSFLEQDLVPVLHGDGIVDNKQGCSILSGDIILPYLATKLRAKKAIFLSDVDGVFDSDPKKNPQAKLISEINDNNLDKILKGLTSNNQNDVSGEMKGKVLEIKNRLKNINVYIVNGLKSKTLLRASEGQAIGTRLLFH